MNAITWFGLAVPFGGWLMVRGFNTYEADIVGIMGIVIILISIGMGIRGALIDWDELVTGGRRTKDWD